MIDTPLLKRIKMIQANDAKSWKGLPVEWVSRPGIDNISFSTLLGLTLNIQSSKKISKTIEYLKMEDERCKIFLEGLIRYREWEEERMNTVY